MRALAPLSLVSLAASGLWSCSAVEPAVVPSSTPTATTATVLPPASPSFPASHASARVPVGETDATWGSVDARVTLVLFATPAELAAAWDGPELTELRAELGPSRLRVVAKPSLVSHPELALHAQAAFRTSGWDGLLRFCQEVRDAGVDSKPAEVEAFVAKRRTPAVELALADVERSNEAAMSLYLGANRSRSIVFVQGRATDWAAVPAAVREELAQAEGLVRGGLAALDVYPTRSAQRFDRDAVLAPAMRPRLHVSLDGAPVLGSADALVTLVEFSDFECPFCRKAHPTIEALRARYGGDLRVAFRHAPLPFHKRAAPLSTVAELARTKGGDAAFFRASAKLLEGAGDGLSLALPVVKGSAAGFADVAAALGLASSEVQAALDTGAFDATLERDLALADDLDARGTPTFFVNGRRISGAQPELVFRGLIDLELESARELVGKGVAPSSVYAELLRGAKAPTPARLPTLPADPARGSAKAVVTVDLYCAYTDAVRHLCAQAVDSLASVERALGAPLRVVLHPMPDGQDDAVLPLLLEARSQKGDAGLWRLHDLLVGVPGDSKNPPKTTESKRSSDELFAVAKAAGLDPKKLAAALEARTHAPALLARWGAAEDVELGRSPVVGVAGRPVGRDVGRIQRAVRVAVAKAATAAPPAKKGP
jgi:protein-disulfide isomerase